MDALTAGAPANAGNTSSALQALQSARAGMSRHEARTNGALVDEAIAHAEDIVADVADGITFDQLKAARTAIGYRAFDRNASPAERQYFGDVYAALTRDMDASAAAIGPDAKQAFTKANNYDRRLRNDASVFGTAQVDEIANKPFDAQIFEQFEKTKKAGGQKLTVLRKQIEAAGGADTWDQLVASSVERMGTKTDADGNAVFDPAMFLKNWTKTSKETKRAMFSGTTRAAYAEDLDRVARVSARLGKYGKQGNHSNTSNHTLMRQVFEPFNLATGAFAGLTGALTGNLYAAGGAMLGGPTLKGANYLIQRNHANKLLDPQFVNMLAGVPNAQMQRGGVRKYLVDYGTKLGTVAARTEFSQYLRDIGAEDLAEQVMKAAK
ncbi:hypothetical protein U0C82_08245 [Fulvimarina sp. 2208YS6-2-32]|uniref:Uncharacterized protein n=1 Tax=Fulvimarina uroteuthidis TaxID=3098149 RepID=A0ABU5I2T5_9HYPH|nr:hypothetical protein [Fulvimarina sp. 2208YS6-2-32]MDY8109134.1 hypothetical protein [Fulvimarina sp. 2208YS6-2-32]